MIWRALLLILPLTGCITAEDRATIDAINLDAMRQGYYDRARIDAINAETQCKALARTLVQIARCEVRR